LALEKIEKEKSGTAKMNNTSQTQYEKAAEALARSFIDGVISTDQIAIRMGRYPENVYEPAVRAFLLESSRHIKLDRCSTFMEAAEALARTEPLKQLVLLLIEICREYQQRHQHFLNNEGQSFEEKALHQLAEQGYTGSAIAGIDPGKIPQWAQTKSKLEKDLASTLLRKIQC